MPELSLAALTLEREGVTLASVEVRRTTSDVVETAELDALGIGDVYKGRLFGFPPERKKGCTYLSASVTGDEKTDDWNVSWDLMPDEDPPEELTESAIDLVGLEDALSSVWEKHSEESITTFHFQYYLDGYETTLLDLPPRVVGQITATTTATFWRVTGASLLSAVSSVVHPTHGLSILAFATFRTAGWPNVAGVEAIVWQDVEQLVKKKVPQ